MRDIKLIDAGPEGAVTWELDITPAYANLNSETSEVVVLILEIYELMKWGDRCYAWGSCWGDIG